MIPKFFLIFFFFFFFLSTTIPKFVGEKENMNTLKINKIVIPAISLNSEVCSTKREFCLNSGVWMKYRDEEKNFLLTGHSFSLLPLRAGVFYSLSDLKVGERIYLKLEEVFVYEVSDVFVTDRFDLEVEDFDNLKNTLVLYSCFPLWSASERIVVRAKLCDSCENER